MKNISLLIIFLSVSIFNIEAQQSKIDSLESLLTQEISDSLKSRVLYSLARKYLKTNPQKGKKHAENGLVIVERNKDENWYNYVKKTLFLNLGAAYQTIGDLDSAYYAYSAAIESNNTQDSLFEFKVRSNLGNLERRRGDNLKALEIFKANLQLMSGITIIEGWEKQRQLGLTNNDMGVAYYYMGDYVKSKDHFYQALNFFDKHPKNHKNKNMIISNLSGIHLSQQEFDEAISLAESALATAIEMNDSLEIIDFTGNIGSYYLAKGSPSLAIKYHLRVLAMTIKLNLLSQKIVTYNQLGDDYLKLDKPDSALYFFLRSYELKDRINSKKALANVYSGIGSLLVKYPRFLTNEYVVANDWNAIKILNEAKKIGLESNEKILISMSYRLLSKLYHQQGRSDKAYLNLLALQDFKDSLFSKEKSKALADADAKYETEKKEQQLVLQESQLAQNELLISKQAIQTNAVLFGALLLSILAGVLYKNYRSKSKSNLEKESLLKEIHHRVKNNLQIIANLLYLQSGKFEDENIKNVLEDGQGRVRSMALIHQKLYENEDLKSIPFGEYVLELVNEIKTSFGEQGAKVNIKVDAPEAFFDVDSAVPLGLIINELTTNAFKYAFEGRDEGQFSIFLTKSGDEYELHIADNGKGIPEEIDIRKTRSLGLRLVRILSEQLEGEYSFESQGGMSFRLKFAA